MNGFYETFIIPLTAPGNKGGYFNSNCSTLFTLWKGEKSDQNGISVHHTFLNSHVWGGVGPFWARLSFWSNWFNIRDDCNHHSVAWCSHKARTEEKQKNEAQKRTTKNESLQDGSISRIYYKFQSNLSFFYICERLVYPWYLWYLFMWRWCVHRSRNANHHHHN